MTCTIHNVPNSLVRNLPTHFASLMLQYGFSNSDAVNMLAKRASLAYFSACAGFKQCHATKTLCFPAHLILK